MLYATDVAQEVRVSEVNRELATLRENFETLKHQVAKAREVLRPVMNESKGVGRADNNAPQPVLCPLAEEIRGIAMEIDATCGAFASVLQSLEV
jgi:outer membrane protein TolC